MDEAESAIPWGTIGTVVVVAGIIGAAIYMQREPLVPPSPEAFPFPTMAAQLPSPQPRPPDETPGIEQFNKGRALLARGDVQGALPLLAEAVSLNSGNALFRHTYAEALWKKGDLNDAIREYQAAAEILPELSYKLDYARTLINVGRDKDARSELERIVQAHPASVEAIQDLAGLLAKAGENEKALGYYKQVAEQRRSDLVFQQEYAQLLEKNGKPEDAAQVYRSILTRQADARVTRTLLADLLTRQGNYDDAVKLYQEGLQRDPNVAMFQRGMGGALERAGRNAEAAEAYRAYAKLAPNAEDAEKLAERAKQLDGKGSS